jgi:hypothetical protein
MGLVKSPKLKLTGACSLEQAFFFKAVLARVLIFAPAFTKPAFQRNFKAVS